MKMKFFRLKEKKDRAKKFRSFFLHSRIIRSKAVHGFLKYNPKN